MLYRINEMTASRAEHNGIPKILIVDDNQDLGFLLQLMLEDEGYEVRFAKDGSEGYLVYLLFSPDVVITDIQMPGKNGLQLMETIRIHNPRARAIYMSGDLSEYWLPLEEERKRYQVGLLEKPFSKVDLMKLLSEAAV